MEHYSSLIARTDPYIVLPGFMARQNGHPFQPKLGDYAVVLAGNKLYPAIFGDIGPSDLMGEASVRLAQAIDPRATPQRSPVDDLKITYLVFPRHRRQSPRSARPGQNPPPLPIPPGRAGRQPLRTLRMGQPDPAAPDPAAIPDSPAAQAPAVPCDPHADGHPHRLANAENELGKTRPPCFTAVARLHLLGLYDTARWFSS